MRYNAELVEIIQGQDVVRYVNFQSNKVVGTSRENDGRLGLSQARRRADQVLNIAASVMGITNESGREDWRLIMVEEDKK